ncbi:MAG TPA: hypothetical protein VE077_22465 [Candidatus Methylomirabilis sp.]|nr:hypothetical protein [Candidatus Methylomirabilis sp.]
MRIAPALSPGQSRRRHLLVFAILIIGAFSAYQLAQYVINDDVIGLAYIVLCIAGASVVVIALNNWRNGMYLFLSWLLFEDLIRKFLGNNMVIYFAKDCLLLVVLISFFAAYRRKEVLVFKPPFRTALLIFIWYGAIQIFNPASTSIWYGLMGFKLFFYYVPLIVLGYALLNSEADLRKFFSINLILALVVISLGIAQSILGSSFLNPAVQAEDLRELSTLYRVSPITGAIAYRPNSVFVSAGRYANFIMVAWMVVLGFSGYLLLRHKRGRMLAFIALPVTAAGAFLTASRGSFMWGMMNALATSIAFLWGAPWKQGEVRRVFRSIQRVAIGIALGMVVLFYAYPDALMSRLAIYEETLLPSSGASELSHRGWTYPIDNFLGAFDYPRWPYGYGIGTTALGSQYVARFFHVRPPVGGVESGFGTLIVEMGIGGLILWFVMSGAILFSAWKVVKKLRGSPWFPLGFVIFWYSFFLLLPATFGGIVAYEDFLLNAYFWLLLGLLFRLPTLTLSAQFALEVPSSQPAQCLVR